MSKYNWIPGEVERHINAAVRCRVSRWTLLDWDLQRCQDKDGRRRIDDQRRRFKYMGSDYIRKAMAAGLLHSRTTSDPHWLNNWVRIQKRLQKDISRRYAVVDRAYDAHILLSNGELRRIWK